MRLIGLAPVAADTNYFMPGFHQSGNQVGSHMPGPHARIFNEMLRQPQWAGMVEPLDAAWNCVMGLERRPRPVVVAWHGVPETAERIHLMRQWLREHDA